MKKKIIIIAIVLAFVIWLIALFFSNNNIISPILLKIIIRSPIQRIKRIPVSDITPTPIKNKQKTSKEAQKQSKEDILLSKFVKGSNRRLMAEKVIETFPEEAETFLAITWSESKFENQASSWCCHGIMQVHEWEHRFKIPTSHNETRDGRIAWLRNPDNNLEVARIIYNDSGKSPWAGYTDGSYLAYYRIKKISDNGIEIL